MAKFEMELPTQIMKDVEKLSRESEKIFGEMTKAGAEVVKNNIEASAPSLIKPYVKTSKTYKTPSDNGINTKVYVSGYIPFSNPNRKDFARRNGRTDKMYRTTKGVPVDFLAILYEYGRSTSPFPKKPFMRKAFRKGDIEQAMMKAQKKASGGLLDE